MLVASGSYLQRMVWAFEQSNRDVIGGLSACRLPPLSEGPPQYRIGFDARLGLSCTFGLVRPFKEAATHLAQMLERYLTLIHPHTLTTQMKANGIRGELGVRGAKRAVSVLMAAKAENGGGIERAFGSDDPLLMGAAGAYGVLARAYGDEQSTLALQFPLDFSAATIREFVVACIHAYPLELVISGLSLNHAASYGDPTDKQLPADRLDDRVHVCPMHRNSLRAGEVPVVSWLNFWGSRQVAKLGGVARVLEHLAPFASRVEQGVMVELGNEPSLEANEAIDSSKAWVREQ